jgi:signal peptidase I
MEAGDTIIVWRTTDFDIGDVAMCLNPQNSQDYVMGRVIAKPGMVVGTVRGQLVIEGETPMIDWDVDETFTDTLTGETAVMKRGVEKLLNVFHPIYLKARGSFRLPDATVGEGRLYLLGDNRTHVGQDSRYFGQVIPVTCRGVVFMRLKPPAESPNDLGHGWLDIIQ